MENITFWNLISLTMAPSTPSLAPAPKAIKLLILRKKIVRVKFSQKNLHFVLALYAKKYKVQNANKNLVLKESCLKDRVLF